MIKNIFLVFLFLFCSYHTKAQVVLGGSQPSTIDYSLPSEYEIGGITVSGTDYLDKNVLIIASGLSVGDKITVPGDGITKAIKSLWELNLFADISIVATKIQGKTIFLGIQVEERPRLSKFSFKGVKKHEADDIREKINLIRGKIVTENLIVTTSNTIKEFFVDKGFLDTKVSITQRADSSAPNSVILMILVNKKQKVKINEIIFEGNKTIASKKLKRAMKETKERKWWNIFKASKYIEENYVADKEKIIAKYNGKGFRDAVIVSDTIYRYDGKYLNIRMKIEEGPKYYFRNITWVGNAKYTDKELNNVLNINKGDVYNQAMLESKLFMSQDSRDITSLYMDDGYLFFQVTPVEILVENDSIDLEMRIYEGRQAIINKITVTGNSKTNDKVILREVRTKPGQLFSRTDIIRTQRDLAQLRYFNPEKLGVNPKPNPTDGTVDIEYVVEEQASDQVELSGGWGAGRIVGTLGVSFNNFSAKNLFKKDAWRPLPAGDGQSLSIRAQSTGAWFQSYNASFMEPWLGGKKPNSLSVSVFHSRQNLTGAKKDDPTRQTLFTTGVSFGLGRRLKVPDDFFNLYNEISFQHFVLSNFRAQFLFSNGKANDLSIKTVLQRNSIDQPIFPRSGSQVMTSLQITPPYSRFRGVDTNPTDYYTHSRQEARWVEYHKWKFTSSWFTRLVDNLVLNTKVGFGFIGSYNKSIGASPFGRFYLGGSGLTGWALDGREIIALRGYTDGSVGNAQGIGDIAICKYTMELRYPFSLNPSATIYGLGFAEAGNAFGSLRSFNPFQVARSAGVGVRVFLPMFGLLGLDYGWGFDAVNSNPTNGRGKGQFHFTIGANIGDL
jgi:outer membrane protein insertion porin family